MQQHPFPDTAILLPRSPLFFGMHPNAEINFRTVLCDKTFDMSPA